MALKVFMSFLIFTFLMTSNAFALNCSEYVDMAYGYDLTDDEFMGAVDTAVDRCLVEAQNKNMPKIGSQIMSGTRLCLETNNELGDMYEATCNLKVVEVASWILKHN